MTQTVLITGCSSGIGRAAAHGLRQAGFQVLATARQADDVAALAAAGFAAHRLDLTDEASIEEAARWALDQCQGRLWGLVNNGAYGQPGALEDLPTDALRRQFDSNFFGWHHLIRQLLPAMLAQGQGRIVQVGSVLGLVAMRFRGAYNSSKFALEGYTDTLRLELRGSGVQISLIEPGPIETRFRVHALAAFRQAIDVEHSRHAEEYRQTIKRLGRAEGSPSGPFTLPAEACLPPLLHALQAKRARRRYRVTRPAKWFYYLRRLLPTAWLDALLARSA